jgi:1-acyl-sn-glycerol-3-phosphate acyltransferase
VNADVNTPTAPPSDIHGGPPPDATVVPGARSLVRRVVQPLLRLWLRLEITDEHHIPAEGPVIIASTHQSHADSMALGAGLSRPVFFLGDVRLTTWPLLGPWLPKLGMVPLRRGERDNRALDVLQALLDAGHAVVVYPEGSRSRDGRIYRPRSGVARLAATTGLPVVPAAVAGIYDVWPIGRRPKPLGGRVTVRFGPAIEPPAQDPRSRREFNRRLHDVLVELSGAERADEYAPAHGGDAKEEA